MSCKHVAFWEKQSGRSYQFVESAVVQSHLGLATLEKIVIVILQTLPVRLELLQAVGVDILDTAMGQPRALFLQSVVP